MLCEILEQLRLPDAVALLFIDKPMPIADAILSLQMSKRNLNSFLPDN